MITRRRSPRPRRPRVIESDYLKEWARDLYRLAPPETLASRPALEAWARAQIAILQPDPHEIAAVIAEIRILQRDNAAPADTPTARGAARMFR